MSWYKQGTVSVISGSNTVTGVGTDFVGFPNNPNVVTGFAFLGPDLQIYEVDQIISSTSFTIIRAYAGTTASAQAYGIFQTQGIIASLSTQVAELLTTFGPLRDAIPTIQQAVSQSQANAAAAAASALLASKWASQATGTVDGTSYSSYGYALQSFQSASLSKNWATQASGTVDGTSYSAYYYSVQSAASAATATTQAGYASNSAGAANSSATAAANSATAATTNGAAQVALATTQANNAAASATAAATTVAGLGFGQNTGTTTGLTYGYFGGTLRIDNTVLTVSNGQQALFANSTYYVQIDRSGNVFSRGDSFQPGQFPMAIVTTGASTITSVVDKRTIAQIAGLNVQASSMNGGPLAGHRNKIINGDMRVAQRGQSATLVSGYTYQTVDRWAMTNYPTGGATCTQVSFRQQTIGNIVNIRRGTGSTNVSNILIAQALETVNSIPLQGQTVTLSFWASAGATFSTAGQTIFASIYTGTGTDQAVSLIGGWTGNAVPLNQSFPLTSTFTRYSATVTLASNISQVAVVFSATPTGTAGSDDSFYLSNVQLEIGPFATPFEDIPYGASLALCQRYYFQSNLQGLPTTPSYGTSSNQNWQLSVNFPVTMRLTPTGSAIPFTDANFSSGTNPAAGQWGVVIPGVTYAQRSGGTIVNTQTISPSTWQWTVYGAIWTVVGLQFINNAAGVMTWSAEL